MPTLTEQERRVAAVLQDLVAYHERMAAQWRRLSILLFSPEVARVPSCATPSSQYEDQRATLLD